jgi:protein-S-isoprenylcysteine O-methyltransferase Ste14
MSRWMPWVLVGLQFVLLAALVIVPRGALWPVGTVALIFAGVLIAAGFVLAVLGVRGLGSALTASPVPKGGSALVTSGVYGRVRHPIYTGLLTGGLGLVAIGASVWHLVLWVALLVLLSTKARWEERMLAATHPDYASYAGRTGRFLPGVGRRR